MGSNVEIRRIMWVVIGVVLIALSGFRSIGSDQDSLNYANLIDANIERVNFNYSEKEPIFWGVLLVARSFQFDQVTTVFLIYSAVGVSIKLLAIYKYSKSCWFSLLVYICLFYVLHDCTQIRTGIASGIFLLAIHDLANKNQISYYFKSILGFLNHYSSGISFLFPALIKVRADSRFYALLPGLGIVSYLISPWFDLFHLLFVSLQSVIPPIFVSKTNVYLELMEAGTHSDINILNWLSICMLGCHFVALLNIRNVADNITLVSYKMHALGLFVFYFCHSFPAIAFRISEYICISAVFLYPNIAILAVWKKIQKILFLIVVSLFSLLYFWNISLGRNLN
jgi:hypothetical protein